MLGRDLRVMKMENKNKQTTVNDLASIKERAKADRARQDRRRWFPDQEDQEPCRSWTDGKIAIFEFENRDKNTGDTYFKYQLKRINPHGKEKDLANSFYGRDAESLVMVALAFASDLGINTSRITGAHPGRQAAAPQETPAPQPEKSAAKPQAEVPSDAWLAMTGSVLISGHLPDGEKERKTIWIRLNP